MADPVVVTPKPASESITIRDNKRIAWVSGLLAFVPTVLEIAFRILSEPAAASWLVNKFPYEARAIVVVVIGIALKAIADRKKVVAPIAGTPAAAELPKAEGETRP